MTRLRLAALPLVLVALSACSTGPLAADEVATRAEDALEERSGLRPDIECPDDLRAVVGARTRCTLTAGDDPAEYDVEITVTSVEGSRVEFGIEVADQPRD